MRLRIFISSPGDVIPERRRAQLVIDKLAKTYARFFAIEPILWETEPMLASGHFQDQIIPPSQTDIVLLIVWSRLGTPLPARTETREYRGIDGRVPVTGTEWEFEDALAGQKTRGAPDILAYRKQADPVVSLKDKAAKAAAETQWEKLDAFWSRWFVDRGEFRAAFREFTDLDGFQAKLESDLSRLIEKRVAALRDAGEDAPALVWAEGSPFRGLDSYRFEHARIFFGRSGMTRAAVEQLTGNAENGRAFLLILGASGAGKSSLAQAGVLPALIGRGIVPGVGLWRRAVMRPGGHPAGPFAALAEALVGKTALPELLASRHDVAALARHLAASADDPAFSIVAVLNQIEDAARARGELLAVETARLALVVDQLEELFTSGEIAADARKTFIRCLDGLARSGRVYVIATMRSDYWHRAAETPLLVEMASGSGRLDLLPARPDEIIEMIRQSAEAAGLEFETDPVRHIKLDATLAAEAAAEPGALPLLSFLLDDLYKKDVQDGGGSTLTYASARALGGLKGAIANRAEAVFADLAPAVQRTLPLVLRALVTVSRTGAAPTARAAPLAQFSEGRPGHEIVAGLLDPRARLLVADGDAGGAQLRLAHEALLTHWPRARDQVAADARDLELRGRLEQEAKAWRDAPRRDKAGRVRAPGLPLDEALALCGRWGAELPAEITQFVTASRHAARRRRSYRLGSLAGAVAALPVIAGLVWAALVWWGVRSVEAEMEAAQDFVSIPAGCFAMGSPKTETERYDDEGPDGPVDGFCVKSFQLDKYEVTQAQWRAVMVHNANPSVYKGDLKPVDSVSWNEVQFFVRLMNSFGRHRYRLPSEAEWEYAARAGTKTARYWGERGDDGCAYENLPDQSLKRAVSDRVVVDCDDHQVISSPVGTFKPNPYGLYDMLGNVAEWVEDCYVEDLNELPKDGSAAQQESCPLRVVRGGSWYNNPRDARAADRVDVDPVNRFSYVGFRLARTIPP